MLNAAGKPQFSLFGSLKYYQILWKHSFWIGYSDVLSKLAAVIFPLCFKKQTFTAFNFWSKAPCKRHLRYYFLGFKIYPDVKKLFHGNFLLYTYKKVIALTNIELRILNCQSKVHEFFW